MILKRNGKTVLVKEHHHAILPWAELARKTGRRYSLLTLDHHTDVLPAFTRSALKGNFDFSSDPAVRRNLELLHHDEHIDWALKAGILDSALILSQENFTEPSDARIRVSCDPVWPSPQEILDSSERARSAARQMLESDFLSRQIPLIPDALILDIDLDCFLCAEALCPRDSSFFLKLASHAALVTVSQESDWIRILRFQGETITAESLFAELLNLIYPKK